MNMREKIGRAIYEKWRAPFADCTPWEQAFVERDFIWPFVDAVLDAMREPSEEIIDAGWNQAMDDDPGPIWKIMIDAIKAGK